MNKNGKPNSVQFSEFRAGDSDMEGLWGKLTLDEKRYLAVRPLLDTDIQAAIYIGRDTAWLDRTKPKDSFKQAVNARQRCGDDEVMRLLDNDLQMLLKAKLAGWVQSGKMEKRDLLRVTHLVAQAVKKDEGKDEGVADLQQGKKKSFKAISLDELAPIPMSADYTGDHNEGW